MPSGLLLALPLESVAVRLVLALGAALLLLRIVSTWELRSPRARTVLAVSPFLVAAAVILLSSGDLGLPSLLVPATSGAGALAVPVADRYLDFVPIGPLLVGLWATVSVTRILLRVVRTVRFRRAMVDGARPAEPRVAAVALRTARSLGITPPRVLMVSGLVGGAAVVGVRDPLLLMDETILARLDDAELEGIVAHELAHVARRDNLLAWAVAVVRDVSFFVPGARWAVHALHREREAAADLDAVAVTGRPAALASGLLRVIESGSGGRRVPYGCAALVPSRTVVDRVELLLRDARPTTREHRTELGLAAAVSLLAVALAVVLPALLAGQHGERDALGVLVGSTTGPGQDGPLPNSVEARVFNVYRGAETGGADGSVDPQQVAVRSADVIGLQDRPGMAAACAAGANVCRVSAPAQRLMLRPQPIVLLDDPMTTRWQATPVSEVVAGDRFAVYWLARLQGTPDGG